MYLQILGKALRVDHVNNYKPPKDDDKLDEETKRLQTEGCAPKPQLPPEAIKREPDDDNAVGGVRLPKRLPIGKIKSESDIKKEKTHKVISDGRITIDSPCFTHSNAFHSHFQVKKEKKPKNSKKSKKEKKSKHRKSSPSSDEDSDSDSDDSDRRRKRKVSKSKR